VIDFIAKKRAQKQYFIGDTRHQFGDIGDTFIAHAGEVSENDT
jgi:hypothetical protein